MGDHYDSCERLKWMIRHKRQIHPVLCQYVVWYGALHTHTCLTALFPGLCRWASTRKVKPIWILLKQETVIGSGVSWAIYKSAHLCRQITMPSPQHSVFYRPDALPATQPTASKHWRHWYGALCEEILLAEISRVYQWLFLFIDQVPEKGPLNVCVCARAPSVLWCCWLGDRKGIRPVRCWCGCLSGARCILAYGPADATATHCLLLQ